MKFNKSIFFKIKISCKNCGKQVDLTDNVKYTIDRYNGFPLTESNPSIYFQCQTCGTTVNERIFVE